MIGFSIVSFADQKGLGYYHSQFESRLFAFEPSSLKSWFEKIKEQKETLVLNDSLFLFRQLIPHFSAEYLLSLPLFDNKSFLHVSKNLTNIDFPDIIEKYAQICIKDDISQIKKIWQIQGENENWDTIPKSIIEVYVEKDAKSAFKLGDILKKNQIDIDSSSYLDFFSTFLIYLAKLEQNGVVDQKKKVHIPRYDYDKTVTGRILNSTPYCFQVLSKEKIANLMSSRFGSEGILISADWKNAEFRVAAALAGESFQDIDPYVSIARKILGKEDISSQERDDIKIEILSIMYGYDSEKNSAMFFELYPNLSAYREQIIKRAETKLKLTNMFGKTRFFSSKDSKLKQKAFSSMNQMTVADLCKKAIIETQKLFEENKLKSVMIPIVIYDQFYFDVLISEKEIATELIQKSLTIRSIPSVLRKVVSFDVQIDDIYSTSR